MGTGREPWLSLLRRKSDHMLVKLFVSLILLGFSFLLFFPRSDSSFPVSERITSPAIATLGDNKTAETPPEVDEPITSAATFDDSKSAETPPDVDDVADGSSQRDPSTADRSDALDIPNYEVSLDLEKCDLFTGEWIRNPLGPAYTNTSCPFIESPQNCMKNGRPDTDYLYWKWKPHGCDVPPFDAEKFLNAMKNKSWALIGDSIFRNHAQSLICLLSKAEEPVEVDHSDSYKSRKWRFNSHNFTLSLIWAPFLVKADIFEDENGASTSEIQLHLDSLDSKWTSEYHNFDYIVISGGQWFLKTAIYLENSTAVGCHYCPGRNLTELGLDYPYRKALQKLFQFVSESDHKPLVIYRTWTPDHFENGEWFSGGTCNRTIPYKKGEFDGRDVDHLMKRIELEEFNKTAVNGSGNGARLKLLDTYHLSSLRPDGHSGPYRAFHPFDKTKNAGAAVQNDCLHWCLPGPIDSWNDLIMKMVLNE